MLNKNGFDENFYINHRDACIQARYDRERLIERWNQRRTVWQIQIQIRFVFF